VLDARSLQAVQVLRKARVTLPDRFAEKPITEQSRIIDSEIEKLKLRADDLNIRRILDRYGILPTIAKPEDTSVLEWSQWRLSNMHDQQPPITSFVAVTSISPSSSRRSVQQVCVTSWQRMGLQVVAVQHAEEIPRLRPFFPGVEFVAAKRRHRTKPNVWINDLADVAIDRNTPVMVINSDIEIRGTQQAFLAKWSPRPGVQTVGVRNNHDGKGDSELEPYGLDVFMVQPDMARSLPELEMMIGVPFWDYWLPYHLREAGYAIEVIRDSTFWHLKHDQNWSANDWQVSFEIFKKHYKLSEFRPIYFRTSLRSENRISVRVNDRPEAMPIPEPGTQSDSVFVFASAKAGSTMINAITHDLCGGSIAYTPVDIPSWLFQRGIEYQSVTVDGIESVLKSPGYCFTGFRSYPKFMAGFPIENMKRVLMVRDPRDIMVSLYYSVRNSHPLPGEGDLRDQIERTRKAAKSMTIDDYVTGDAGDWMAANIENLANKVIGDGCLCLRYEDMVYRKRDLADHINSHFTMSVFVPDADAAADRQDVFPARERVAQHIRQVKPGNFRKKLKPATIKRLNAMFAESIQRHLYEP
jgi:hypothetical protein